MASRALVLREGIAPVRDRLVMTLFLAAVLHGIIILGITFSAGTRQPEAAPGLEVLLVSDELPSAERNDHATFLAQRTQLGSGNTDEAVRPRNRASAPPLEPQDGVVDGTSPTTLGSAQSGQDERVLATTAAQPDIRWFGELDAGAAPGARPLDVPAHATAEPGPQDEPGPVELRGPRRDELWVTPDSREAALAPYLDSWRRRVERIGTLNFPAAARRAGAASPEIEVAIEADGHISRMLIRRSSGDPELDQAALSILKLASPFDRFPAELAQRYRTLRFVYVYQFLGGRAGGGALNAIP
ncbi:MAG TPA: energy transducer TonB [Steroidobacteraceae bacterium]|nr:energy transducer TonB [Steroidobacteraceae bacterium]